MLKNKVNFLFFLSFFILAILIRYAFLEFKTLDYIDFISKWYDFILKNGVFKSFAHNFSNYSPPYLHLLAFSTLLPFKKIYSIKLISILFDFLLAGSVALIIKNKTKKLIDSLIAFFIILFLPTVLLNGSLWGQCDSIYVSFLILSIYFLIKKKNNLALFMFGVAIAFKFQAIFLSPFLLALYLKKYISFKNFLWIPLVVILSFIPSLISGRPFIELLKTYSDQANYKILTLQAPNLYHWISNDYFSFFYNAGILFTILVALAGCFFVYHSKRKMDDQLIIKLALASALLIPFFLPKMHERYFFLADILSVLYAFYNPKKIYIPFLIIAISSFSYIPYLFGKYALDFSYLVVAMGVVIIIILHDIAKDLKNSEIEN